MSSPTATWPKPAKDLRPGDQYRATPRQRKNRTVHKIHVFDKPCGDAQVGDLLLLAPNCAQTHVTPETLVYAPL
jgi:hypothetical protein